MKTKLSPADLQNVWDLVSARLVENRRLSIQELYFETLDEYARIKAQIEASDPFVFAVGTTRWRARATADGGLELIGDANPAARR